MGTVILSMSHSLDGYITGPDGGFDWSAPDEQIFQAALDEVRGLSAHLLGRRLYETMVYWDDPANSAGWTAPEHEFAEVWRALPKIVFSTTLSEVRGANTRLASDDLVVELSRLRDDPTVGEVAIGGATLAAAAADAGLIDEYRGTAYPALVGGGVPFFPRGDRQVELELVSSRTFDSRVVATRYRVVRSGTGA